jgi:hypothetical protein
MFLINFYQGKDMYNFKCLSLIIISLVLVGCGGSSTDTASTSSTTVYNAAASEGELMEYSLDETNLTYSYKITSSAVGLDSSTRTGTLTKNADGTYTPSTAPSAKVLILPNKLAIAATKLTINGVDRYTLIAGIPTTTNVQFSDIAGTYNYVSLQCLTTACNNSTGDPESAYGTFNISTSGSWVECTRSNYTASPSGCAGRDSGTLNSLGNGKFQIISGSTDMGTGMFYHSPTGQKIMVIDLKNYLGSYGRGLIFGVPQVTANLGGSLDGKYHWNTTLGTSGWVSAAGATYTLSNGYTGSLTPNSPWLGMVETNGGYGMIADEGVYMWTSKYAAYDTYLEIGTKEQ